MRVILILSAVVLLVAGCPGDRPKADGKVVTPDAPIFPDFPALDRNQTVQPDGYQAQPFGCTADSDCFGQRCCPTPWGVKLCALACGTLP
jgi:hypothetical protein